MQPAFSPLIRFSLLITLTIVPVVSRSQASDLRTKDTFAIGEESSFRFEFRKGMIFVPVRINGSKPLSFVLDTGSARMLIDRTLADNLGLKRSGQGSLQGAGAAVSQSNSFTTSPSAFPGWRAPDTNSPLQTFSPFRPASAPK